MMTKMQTIIDIKEKPSLFFYIEDYLYLTRTFKDIYDFLHKTNFSQVGFGSVYLTRKKKFGFDYEFDILSFKKVAEILKVAFNHQKKVINRVALIDSNELNTFF